jgi:hypothetical protein
LAAANRPSDFLRRDEPAHRDASFPVPGERMAVTVSRRQRPALTRMRLTPVRTSVRGGSSMKCGAGDIEEA